jgi:hypothetical protein
MFTRGSLGLRAEVEENRLPLCRIHHTMAHEMGRDSFARLYHLEGRYKEARLAIAKSIWGDRVEDVTEELF